MPCLFPPSTCAIRSCKRWIKISIQRISTICNDMEIVDAGTEQYWYAVHVRSRHEIKVVERLTLAGKEAFLPTVERQRKWKDRKKTVAFPLFPGYVFVHVSKSSHDRMFVLKTKGVVRFLCTIPGETSE